MRRFLFSQQKQLNLVRRQHSLEYVQVYMHHNLVSWCRLRRRRNEIIFFFSCLQLDALRSLKMNSTMNIVDNYRPVQNLGSRKVKSSFSSTQTPPTTTAVPVPAEAASVALKISNVLLMLVLFLGEVFFH